MRSLRALLLRLGGLFRKNQRDAEFSSEMESHLQMHIEDNLRAGLSAEEARRQALIKLGGIEQTKESYRERRGLPFLETLFQDLRFAARTLLKDPGFSVTLILILALGIGGATAIYAVVDGVLLRPLPFPHPQELMEVNGITYPAEIDPLEYWSHNLAFDQLANSRLADVNLSRDAGAERVAAGWVSASWFPVLGVSPMLGRTFSPDEEVEGRNSVVVLSYGLWVDDFGMEKNIVGRTVRLNGIPHTVIGIMPADFSFTSHVRLWVPMLRRGFYTKALPWGDLPWGLSRQGWVVGRLRPGVTTQQAGAVMTALAHSLQAKVGNANYIAANEFVRVFPLQESFVREFRSALLILLGAVLFLLLIVCANAANMLLARTAVRQKEVGIRLCLGATRARVVRQLVTESLLLALIGGTLGTLFAGWFLDMIRIIAPASLPRMASVQIDPKVLAFGLAASTLTGILVGLAPAMQSFLPELTTTLKEEGYRSTGRIRPLFRATLVVGEVALSLVLLSGAGVTIQAFYRLAKTNLGFDPRGVLTADFNLPLAKLAAKDQGAAETRKESQSSTKEQMDSKPADRKKGKPVQEISSNADSLAAARLIFQQQVLEKVRSLPGVAAAATVDGLPLTGRGGMWFFDVEGRPTKPAGGASVFHVSSDYFRAIGIPILAGRAFTESEEQRRANVIIVSRTLARGVWPGKNPIGEHLTLEGNDENPREVVGVVEDVSSISPDEFQGSSLYDSWQFYFPGAGATLVVRTASDPAGLIAPLRTALLSMDEDLAVYNVRRMSDVFSADLAQSRFRAILLGLFAFFAFFLAVMGVYGVMAYSVACRTHEIGVRVALGAQAKTILQLILGEGLRFALIGASVGLVLAFALNRVLNRLLFGISPADVFTLAWSAALLIASVFLACLVPAYRAARMDPMVALRYE